ncbi:MAG: hypothetical protein ACLQDF_08905 [Desulfomonilia bacterium]
MRQIEEAINKQEPALSIEEKILAFLAAREIRDTFRSMTVSLDPLDIQIMIQQAADRGDDAFLAAMLGHHRPSRWLKGYSSMDLLKNAN